MAVTPRDGADMWAIGRARKEAGERWYKDQSYVVSCEL